MDSGLDCTQRKRRKILRKKRLKKNACVSKSGVKFNSARVDLYSYRSDAESLSGDLGFHGFLDLHYVTGVLPVARFRIACRRVKK